MHLTGIKNGMIMQRNEKNFSEITVFSDTEITGYFTAENGQIYPLNIEKDENRYKVSGIPVGGPYEVSINGQCFKDIYVGDIWLLAGQSNMEGMAEFTPDDKNYVPRDEIRELHMADHWEPARPVLHEIWKAYDKVHTEWFGATLACFANQIERRCIGPGLFFANHMYDYEKVPQGVIPCAHGGTTMTHWDPSGRDLGGEKSLYGAMYRRFVANGSHVRGLFWYQGCSDANPENAKYFEGRMRNFVECVRRDFGKNLPIVQVQISRVAPRILEGKEGDVAWSGVREIQRKLTEEIPYFETAATICYELCDSIHIARSSQLKAAENAAELMCGLIHNWEDAGAKPSITVDENIMAVSNDYDSSCTDIIVRFGNLHGGLKGDPAAFGFSIWDEHGENYNYAIYRTKLRKDTAIVQTSLPPDIFINAKFFLAYGYGLNAACNITDEKGYAIPAFGPLEIVKWNAQ